MKKKSGEGRFELEKVNNTFNLICRYNDRVFILKNWIES